MLMRLNHLITGKEFRGSSRPSWCLLGKITHHMETVLFREKFQDWPDAAAVIRVKEEDKILARALADESASGEIEVEPFDAHVMAEWAAADPDLELEGAHLGRGTGYYDETGRRRKLGIRRFWI